VIRNLVVRVLALAVMLTVIFVVLRTCLGMLGLPSGRAGAIAGSYVFLLGVTSALVLHRIASPTFGGPPRVLLVAWSVLPGSFAGMLLWAWLAAPVALAALGGALIALAASFWYRRTAVRDLENLWVRDREVEPRTSAEAQAMIDAARRAVADPHRRIDRHMRAELNLARGLMWLSMLDHQPHAMAEARQIIRRSLVAPGVSRRQALSAAADLFGTVDSYAKETGDGTDFPVVMRICEDLARGVPDAEPLIFEQRADYAVFRIESAVAAGAPQPDTAAANGTRHDVVLLLESASADLLRAIDAASDTRYRMSMQCKLALVDTQLITFGEADPDAAEVRYVRAERLCREAARSLDRRLDPRRVFARLSLAMCLMMHVDARLSRHRSDAGTTDRIDEVERICRRQLRRRTDFEPALLSILSDALAARERVTASEPSATTTSVQQQPSTPLEVARAAYRSTLHYGNVNRTRAAEEWCAQATAAGDPAEAADAYRERILAAADDAKRQVSLDRRRQFLSGDGVLAEAGFRLLAADRVQEAVSIVEFGRGIQMRRSLGAMTVQQRNALLDNGHGDLLAGYQTAVAGLATLVRGQHLAAPPALDPISVGGRQYEVKGLDPLHDARTTVETYEKRIADVLGRPPEPTPYEDIQQSATGAPLVYIGAAGEHGWAIIVQAHGEPEVVRLPTLTHGVARRLAERIGSRSTTGDVPAAPVAEATEAMISVLGPLAEILRLSGPLVTLVPLGPLALLPLHAAFVLAGLSVRHTPSARTLPPGTSTVQISGRVLTIQAARPGPAAPPPLKLVGGQRELLARLHGQRLRVLVDATGAEVLDGFGTAEIYHFMCHGAADPEHPLDSSLFLADRQLRLSEIMAMPPVPQRLVILGACESSVADGRVLDEMVSFPGAMLQAGAQGVVAALWKVSEAAAALVLQRFHEGLAARKAPATALADAQRWLRSATRGEIARRYPQLYRSRLRGDHTVRPFADAVDWAAFTYTGT
jgi:hypothetical protein